MRQASKIHGRDSNIYKILTENVEGKRPFGRPTHRWKDNIKMCLKGSGRRNVNWNKLV